MSEEFDPVALKTLAEKAISQPLVTHIYTADPSAHVFEGRIYIYPSHDFDAGIPENDDGDHFGMEDYHVLRMDSPDGEAVDCGLALHVKDVPWAQRQMWAPDAAYKNGRYYLYFPAKRADGIFQIGVAVSDDPAGPFVPEPEAMVGSYSIDPAVFANDDGAHYMYFGGIWGGQLQKYRDNTYGASFEEPADGERALGPRVARLNPDMKQFAEAPREVLILDENGQPLRADDHERRFFEASWLHKHRDRYYFSYSTGNTHLLCYSVADNPYGPFTYQGTILTPVVGWTTHHSICEFEGRSYLFYHDCILSGGVTHLRSVKLTELQYDEHGRIHTIDPYGPDSHSGMSDPVLHEGAMAPIAPGALITIGMGSLSLDIAPEAGGRIAQIRHRGIEQLIGHGESEAMIVWGSYPMAPWAGRIRHGRFDFGGRTVRLPLNLGEHAIHGVAFAMPWRVDACSSRHVELSLPLPEDERWPFGGIVRQHIDVASDSLRMVLSVTAGDRAMPVTLGWHPWLRKPDRVVFAPSAFYPRDAEGIATLPLAPPPPGPWDECFVNQSPVLVHRGDQSLRLTSDCSHWVVYDEAAHATCIEPQSGPPDAFNLAQSVLAPGETTQAWFLWEWL